LRLTFNYVLYRIAVTISIRKFNFVASSPAPPPTADILQIDISGKD